MHHDYDSPNPLLSFLCLFQPPYGLDLQFEKLLYCTATETVESIPKLPIIWLKHLFMINLVLVGNGTVHLLSSSFTAHRAAYWHQWTEVYQVLWDQWVLDMLQVLPSHWNDEVSALLNVFSFFWSWSNTYPGFRDLETEVQRLGLHQRTNPGQKLGWVLLPLFVL